MRVLYNHRRGAGEIYELENMKAFFMRLPAYVVVAALYGKPFPPCIKSTKLTISRFPLRYSSRSGRYLGYT